MIKKKVSTEKKWYQSKTLLVNGLIIIGGLATWIAGQIDAGATITLVGLLNTLLRLMTRQGIIGTIKK
jgi:hypothetical protein